MLAAGLAWSSAASAHAACSITDGPSLQTAVTSAAEGGGTVTLCQDISYSNPDGPGLVIPTAGTVTLELGGHTLDLTGDAGKAGILTTDATLTVNGPGTLRATGGGTRIGDTLVYVASGAGIGGNGSGGNPGGTVTINGGTVIAKGGDDIGNGRGLGAGIGGGGGSNGGVGGSVTINGGTVTATGGDNATHFRGSGAGIGGGGGNVSGIGGAVGTVTINGGTVTATGGSGAAGIGGGRGYTNTSGGAGGTVTIASGAVVSATGGPLANAAIGSNGGVLDGTVSNSGTLTLTGNQTNYGTLTNSETGVIKVNTWMAGPGVVTNDGTIRLTGGTVAYDQATIENNAYLIGYEGGGDGTVSQVLAPSFAAAGVALPAPPAGSGWYTEDTCEAREVTVDTRLSTWFGPQTVEPDTSVDPAGNLQPNVTLHAKQQATVVFDANGGTGSWEPTTVAAGCSWGRRTTPGVEPRPGYSWVGWSTTRDGSSGEYDFTTPITEDLTLYVMWVADHHTLTFDPRNGGATFAQQVAHGKPATAPTVPTRAGWVFGGWYSAAVGGAAWDFDAAITKDRTLYAQWTRVTVDRSSVVAGGRVTVTGEGYAPGERVRATLHSGPPYDLGTHTADRSGRVSFQATVPADFQAGDHTVTLVGQTSRRTASAALAVTAPAPPPLADTGSSAGPYLPLAGLALVLAGAVTVGIARHRGTAGP